MHTTARITTTRYERQCVWAFTVVELLCVLIILGIIAGIAVPRYANTIAQNRAAALARRITIDLALAQRKAKLTGVAHKVKFPPADNKYLIPGMDDPDHPGKPYEVYVGEEPYNATLISSDLGGDDEIIFNGYGLPDSGGTIVIAVGDYAKEITVAEQTAQVSVVDVELFVIVEEPLEVD